jgi:hypothetical protein
MSGTSISTAAQDIAAVAVQSCSRCGSAFTCGAESGTATCWCVELPRLQNIRADQTCLCPACLQAALKEESHAVLPHSPGGQR